MIPMKSSFFVSFAALAVLGTGCVTDNPYAYQACKTSRDCSGLDADTCVGVTQNWGGGDVVSNGVCTTYACSSDYDCARSHNNELGYCSKNAILGTDPFVCYERCYYDADCATGFVCATSYEVYGLRAGESICVPQPGGVYVPPPLEPYSYCNYDDDCYANGGTTDYCVTYDPKWINQTVSAALEMCTVECTFDSDCPLSRNGDAGYCAPQDSVTDGQVCVERCAASNECDVGFICTQMRDLAGLPNSTEGICAPDPNY